ncbi:MAG: S-layer homology domain-containing protein, partial [Faecousia sp.]
TMTGYLIDTCTTEEMSFFEKLNAVQAQLNKIAVYPRSVYNMDDPNEKTPYPLLASSPYPELGLNEHYNMYNVLKDGILVSKAYPFVLDSASFPGTLRSVAKQLEPECEVASAGVHYMINITFEGETHAYGGAGVGGNDPLYSNRVEKVFTFSGSGDDFGTNGTVEDYYTLLRGYEPVAKKDAEKYRDLIRGTTFCQTIQATGGTWIRIGVEGFFGFGTSFGYVVPLGTKTMTLSDAWVDGRYIGNRERIVLNERFEDHPTADITLHDVTFTDRHGQTHTQDVVYSYDKDKDAWTAPYFYNGDYWYSTAWQLPDELILTREQVEAMEPDYNSSHWPEGGLVYDGTEYPGTPFTMTLVTGVSVPETLELYEGESATITALVQPADAFDTRVSWTSSDSSVVEVRNSGTGAILACSEGTAVLAVVTLDGSYAAACTVTVLPDPCKDGHSYTETITAPTCTAQGYTTHTCIYCGDCYKDTYTAALGHNYSYKVTTTPTTSATGALTGTCGRCTATTTVTLPKLNTTDYSYSVVKAATCTAMGTGRYTWKTTTYGSFYFDVTLAKIAHNYTTKVTAPTCTEQGYTTHTCAGCGDSYKDTYTAALGHNYSYKVTTTPTTSATGALTGTCGRCTATTTVTLPKLNTTDYSYSVVKAATCTATGTGRYTWKTTTYGSFYFDVTIAKTAHNYTATVTAPTCTAQGYTTHTCTGCGDSYKDTYTAALGHSYSYKVTTTPTTSATGVLTGTCSRCTATTTVTLPKLNTTDYSYSVVNAATCTATGTGRYTWKTTTYGSFYFDVTLAKIAHNYTTKVTAPTCTEQGYTTHTCTACGDSYKDTYTAALGHSESAWIVDRNATCTASGSKHTECTRCGVVMQTETISAAGHSDTTSVTAPTCTEKGFTTHTCAVCGDSYQDTYTPELGHAWDNGTVTTQPTETTEGVKTFACTRCGETKTERIPMLGHTHQYTEQVTAPTCTEKGFTTHTCAVCGDSYQDTYTAELGHAWDNGTVTTQPTETTEGVKTFTCTRCGETRTERIPASGEQPETPCDGGADCPSARFRDVNAKEWYHPYVDYAVAHGLFGGTGDTTFEPETAMTRAMLVTVLWRYEGKPTGYQNSFTDVNAKDGSWYIDAVAWAAANGIVGGVGNGKFDPDGNITREQMAAILFRYAGKKGIDTSKRGDLSGFPDSGKISSWAKDAVQWTVAEKIINGSDGKLLPQGNATRAQVAAILMRFIENIVKA